MVSDLSCGLDPCENWHPCAQKGIMKQKPELLDVGKELGQVAEGDCFKGGSPCALADPHPYLPHLAAIWRMHVDFNIFSSAPPCPWACDMLIWRCFKSTELSIYIPL